MRIHAAVAALPLALGLVACNDAPLTQGPVATDRTGIRAQIAQGSGIVLNSVTGLSLPLIGRLGQVVVDQAVITNVAPIEDAVGQIVGIDARGVLQLTGGVLGSDVVTEDFSTEARVTNSGPGQCGLLSIDLGPITVNALVASVDIPAASVDASASGAVGSLLCSLLSQLPGGA